jgi:hypothetical protein
MKSFQLYGFVASALTILLIISSNIVSPENNSLDGMILYFVVWIALVQTNPFNKKDK